MQAVAVIVSTVLSIGIMIAMTANAFASEGENVDRGMVALTNRRPNALTHCISTLSSCISLLSLRKKHPNIP